MRGPPPDLFSGIFDTRLPIPSPFGNLNLSQPISGPNFWSHSSKSSGSLCDCSKAVRAGSAGASFEACRGPAYRICAGKRAQIFDNLVGCSKKELVSISEYSRSKQLKKLK
jgi:hypothetical protein